MRTRLLSPALSMGILLMAASGVYPQYGGGDGIDEPFTIRSSTIQEGVQRGFADVLRSWLGGRRATQVPLLKGYDAGTTKVRQQAAPHVWYVACTMEDRSAFRPGSIWTL